MTFVASDHIQTILKNLPLKPGVYIMKDARGVIIYIGKAKKLRNRVRSYFNSSAESNLKTMKLRENIVDIEFIVEENEIKALILEETMIKRHKPRYNISLKDDKHYPYIRISWQMDFPKVEATRRIFASGRAWTFVRGRDLEEGEIQGLPVWSRHVGDPILASNLTRRVDFALFMVDAITNPALVHEAPATVGRLSASAQTVAA